MEDMMPSHEATLEMMQFQRARTALEVKVRKGTARKDNARHLAEDLLQFDFPIAARYKTVDVIRILQDNCQRLNEGSGLRGLINGLGILERYGKNLLRSERPSLWRVVRLSNHVFRMDVDIIEGARAILHQLGYTKQIEDGLSYPDDVLIPDIPFVATVTADILLLRQELLMLANREHKQEHDFYSYIRREEILAVQEEFYARAVANGQKPAVPPSLPSEPVTMSGFQNSNNTPYPRTQPPTYENVLRGEGTPVDLPTIGNRVPPSSSQRDLMTPTSTEFKESEQQDAVAENDIHEEELCDLCGQNRATCQCHKCNQIFCDTCNGLYHSNPKRRDHLGFIVPLENDPPLVRSAPQPSSVASRTSNGFLTSSVDPMQERSPHGSHIQQPTISGERLPPTLNSRPSVNDHDNEWTRKINRMADDLMDIGNSENQKKKLMECLAELDREAEKYRQAIETLMSKPDTKFSLVTHFQERLGNIDDAKVQLKLVCGYIDPTPAPSRSHPGNSSSMENSMNFQTSGSYSFRSSPFTDPSSSNLNRFEVAAPHQVPPKVDPPLIDLTTEPAETIPLDLRPTNATAAATVQHAAAAPPYANARAQAKPSVSASSLEDPELQSVFTQPPIPPEASTLKRSLENGINEAEQPAKIQQPAVPDPATQTHPHEFTEPELPDSGNEEEFQSAEGGPDEQNYDMVQNQVEEPKPKVLAAMINMTPEVLQDRIKKEDNRYQTTQFLDYIRAGDSARFRPEQVETAVQELEKEGNANRFTPNAWLERNWDNGVKTFIGVMKTKGLKISKEDTEDVILEANYNFDEACRLIERAQIEQISDLVDVYGKDEAKRAIAECKGDQYLAWMHLQKRHIKDVYDEFNRDEDVNEEDLSILKRIALMDDNEKKYQAYTVFFEFTDDISQAQILNAMYAAMPNDMLDTPLKYTIECVSGDEVVDAQTAIHYLDNECMICTEKFPRSMITCLPTCGDNGCMYCRSCLEQHLRICVRDKNIRDIVCPVCTRPEINSDEETQTNFFNHIDAVLRQMNDQVSHEIFQQKVRDFTLMRMPNFQWCSHCSGGFLFEPVQGNLKMTCLFCQKGTCYKCKKQWEPQHDDATCEEFQQWKEQNDPEYQAAGLARHLKENGIDCPDCKFRYALAKGGCMHFKCTQCSHEFCSGCHSAFKHGRKCRKFHSCQNKGLHAHHPRDCLFFLRDSDPDKLKKLLRDNNVQFNTKGPNNKTCQVMEQKDTPTGLQDDACGRAVEPNFAGLCRLHYMEYLVNLVNTHRLDPADVFTHEELVPCLMREDIPVPQRNPRESNEAYRKRLLAEVKKIPLLPLKR